MKPKPLPAWTVPVQPFGFFLWGVVLVTCVVCLLFTPLLLKLNVVDTMERNAGTVLLTVFHTFIAGSSIIRSK